MDIIIFIYIITVQLYHHYSALIFACITFILVTLPEPLEHNGRSD